MLQNLRSTKRVQVRKVSVNTKLMLSLALFAMTALSAFGQTFGEINGTVTDSSGSVVAGTTVTVTNPQTNFTRSTSSNENGNYNFPDLPPGNYTVKAEKQGFPERGSHGGGIASTTDGSDRLQTHRRRGDRDG